MTVGAGPGLQVSVVSARARPSIPARTGDEAGEEGQRKGTAGEYEWHEGDSGAATEVGEAPAK